MVIMFEFQNEYILIATESILAFSILSNNE